MNKIIIITGGANGLGFELVKILHQKGFFICNIDKDKKRLEEMEKDFSENYSSFCGNVADEKFAKNCLGKISSLGEIYSLINCAGSPSFRLPTDYTSKDVDLCFEGLKGMIYFSTQTLKSFNEEGGKIVNIMSSAALRGNKQESVYCATKWAERGYTESLKTAYSGTKVQIFGVYPGGINTNFYKNSRDYVSVEKQKTFMSAKELAEVIVDNVFTNKKLVVEDLIINRLK